MADFLAGTTYTNGNHNDDGSSTHSRHSSISSDRSGSVQGRPDRASAYVVKDTGTPAGHDVSDDSSDVSSQQLILRDGGLLVEESRTEITSGIFNQGFVNASVKSGEQEKSTGNTVDLPPRQPTSSGTGTARHKVNKSASYASSIPEVEITIPNDGSLASFSTDSMAAFFRCLRVEERLVGHLHKTGVDGRKFGRLKDSDLDTLQINNPVIVFFRDRTAPAANKKPAKNRLPFVL